MKITKVKAVSVMMAITIIVTTIVQCPMEVYAVSDAPYYERDIVQAFKYGVETGEWEPFWGFIWGSAGVGLFLASEYGAIVDKDFTAFAENYETFMDKAGTLFFGIDEEEETITANEQFGIELKKCIQEYAAQNEPYKIMTSYILSDIPTAYYGQKNIYDSIKNLVNEYPDGEIYLGRNSQTYNGVSGYALTVVEFEHPQEVAFVASTSTSNGYYYPYVYSWKTWEYLSNKAAVYRVFLSPDDDAIQSLQEIKEKAYENANADSYWSYYYREYDGSSSCNSDMNSITLSLREQDGSNANLLRTYGQLMTSARKHIRVYTTKDDMMDYTVNRRKVYYTSDWYDKEPTSITVDLTEIEDRLDDMDAVLKQLLEQISDNEDESRIEELLQQILDALNGIDTGGGSGDTSGGGTVVEYDDTSLRAQLSTYFSQVLSYLKQIVGKISDGSAAEDTGTSLPDSIGEKLDEIIDQLKSIKKWAAIDAVASGADAVADWLSYINDLLNDAESGTDAVVVALSTAFTDTVGLLKAKFPFSLPWDVIAIVEVMAAEPETPVFVLPLHIDSLSYNYDFVIDMAEYEIISKISRTFLTLLYALGLIKLSGRFIDIKKGG